MIPLIDTGLKLIEKLVPDKDKQAELKVKLKELEQNGELAIIEAMSKIDVAQAEVNKQEAKGNWFRAGWRPFLAWVCSIGFVFNLIVFPLASLYGIEVPQLDMSDAIALLVGMLGLGTMRTVEKLNGIN